MKLKYLLATSVVGLTAAASAPAYESGLLTPEQIAAWEAAKGN